MAVLDDFAIDYVGKRIYHNSGTTVWDVNALYSALQDTFDELGQMDDDVPMSAQTPTEYSLINGWYMNSDDMQYLKNGAIKTLGWDTYGMVKVDYSAETVQLVPGDKGKACSTPSYNGTLVDYVDNGTTGTVWIRPATASDTFDSAELLSCDTGSVTLSAATNITGNSLWANPFSLGTIEPDTTLYIVQDSAVVTGWWPEGHLNVLLLVSDMGVEIDEGVIEVFAHKPGTLFDHFQIDLSSGGKQPVPLATASDINDTNGWRSAAVASGTGAFSVGEIVTATGVKAIVTENTGIPTTAFKYFLLGDLTDFTNTQAITGSIVGANGTISGAPSATGISTNDWDTPPAFTFSNDIDIGDAVTGDYAITIDMTGYTTLLEVYEKFKYDFRRGNTTTFNGVEGEEFVGLSVSINYTESVAFTTIGQTITGATSNATGILAAVDSTAKILYLHNVKGSFTDTETVSGSTEGSGTNITAGTVALNKQCPFASFAGGTMFGAAGVRFINVQSGYANSYFMTDLAGVSHAEPTQRTITVNKLVAGDRILLTRRSGTDVLEAEYNLSGAHSAGGTSIVIQEAIANDKPSVGAIHISNVDGSDDRYRYSSWATSTFTLQSYTGLTCDAGASATVLTDTDGAFNSKTILAGDIIRNTGDGSWAYVVSKDSDTQLTTTALTGGSTNDWNADTYEINTLNAAYANGDDAYVPFLSREATSDTEAVTVQYVSDKDVTLRVRKKGILPFSQDTAFTDADLTLSAIRTTDSIVT